ncbi:3D domain-containing protein [Desulfolithobacter sp.]
MLAGWMFRSFLVCVGMLVVLSGCARYETRIMETTAYCGCEKCCSWERGSWKYLKMDFWKRYVSEGRRAGAPYTGKTASGSEPVEPHPGLVSTDTLQHPWTIPARIVFPWLWLERDGTIAADTRYYPFGTRMYVPGYGWGVVADRGGAIKGPDRIDLYFDSHEKALQWGRRRLEVKIER